MVREICQDPLFLARPAQVATREDLPVAQDLIDTLTANRERCVGMAANMIGIDKAIIAVDDNGKTLVMLNPEITTAIGPFSTEEGCLSHSGVRPVTRYKKIMVRYQTMNFKKQFTTFTGWTAQIIQHEVDHCKGILI